MITEHSHTHPKTRDAVSASPTTKPLDAAGTSGAAGSSDGAPEPLKKKRFQKILKPFYVVLGLLCFVLGAIGVVLPILPTTPFLLVSAFCFTRSSKRLNDWFVNTGLYKKHLDDFVKTRSMKLKTQVIILVFASSMLIAGFIFSNNLYARILIACVIIVKYYYFIFRVKTIWPNDEKQKATRMAETAPATEAE